MSNTIDIKELRATVANDLEAAREAAKLLRVAAHASAPRTPPAAWRR